MVLVIDTSAVIAVVLDEPEKKELVRLTEGADLVAPRSLHWEVGNALAAMFRQRRISPSQADLAIERYEEIVIRFAEVDLKDAVRLAHAYKIYAYDAYMLACALRLRRPLLTLDGKLGAAARAAGVAVMGGAE